MQCLLVNGTSTTKRIGEALSDIPTPTLYRHMKVLLDADVIRVVEEEQVRGAVQKIYSLNPEMMGDADVAEKLCNKIAIIKGGKLVAFGTMEELVTGQSLEELFMEVVEDGETD